MASVKRAPANVIVAVVQVVDDADVFHLELVNDGKLILRFAEPSAMIVESHFAAGSRRCCGNRPNPVRFRGDPRFVFPRIFRR